MAQEMPKRHKNLFTDWRRWRSAVKSDARILNWTEIKLLSR